MLAITKRFFCREGRLKLDSLGLYYAYALRDDDPFAARFSVYLRAPVDPQALRRAADSLAIRMPYLCGRLERTPFTYYFSQRGRKIKTVYAREPNSYSTLADRRCYDIFTVYYGERHITAEATHKFMDGRGLVTAGCELLTRYFEIAGLPDNKDVPPDGAEPCGDGETENVYARFWAEETEDAYARYGAGKTSAALAAGPVYHHNNAAGALPRLITRSFSLDAVAAAAKGCGATISEYITARILLAYAAERDARGSGLPVSCRVSIDNRKYCPSGTLRNFVCSIPVTLSGTPDIAGAVGSIRRQFAAIGGEYVLGQIGNILPVSRNWRLVPARIKKLALKKIADGDESGFTVCFSNLGLIRLPVELEEKIEKMDISVLAFAHERYKYSPCRISCVSFGKSLTLSAVSSLEDIRAIGGIFESLEKAPPY